MNASPDGTTLNAIADLYYAEDDGTRKAISYFRAYEERLAARRGTPLRILELGVSSGASMLVWRDYLPLATIVGIDIADRPECLAEQARVQFIQGSQDDPATLDLAARIAGGSFDFIIDDASHIGYLTKRSFNYLFPRWLLPGGCYVIEDFGTGFLPEYPDGASYIAPPWDDAVPGTAIFQSHQYGMVGVVKQLIDHLMQELMTKTRSYLTIERISIEPNIAFIEKAKHPGPPVPWPLPGGMDTGAAAAPSMRLGQEPQPGSDETHHRLDEITEQLRLNSGEVLLLKARVAEMEQVVGTLPRRVEPLRRLWRTFAGRRHLSEQNR